MKNLWIYLSIFILTIGDAIFTAMGVKDGYIMEGNPLFEKVMHASPELSSALVVVGVGLLLLLIYKIHHRIQWIRYGLVTMFIVKLGVLAMHLNWIRQI